MERHNRTDKLPHSVEKRDIVKLRTHLKLQDTTRGHNIATRTRLLQLSEGSIVRAKLTADRMTKNAQKQQENETRETIITNYLKGMGKHRSNKAALITRSGTNNMEDKIPGSILYTEINYLMPPPTWTKTNTRDAY